MKSLFIFLFFLSVDSYSCFGQCSSPTHPDYNALMAFYNSTNGQDWDNQNGWADGAAGISCEPCADQWEGIECDNNRVIEIFLRNNNLVGTLPENLTQLLPNVRVNLGNNDLHGCIPQPYFDYFCPNFINWNLVGNSRLPWQGGFLQFCQGQNQIGAFCRSDSDPNTSEVISANCNCGVESEIYDCNSNKHPDYDALMALYASTDGDSWLNKEGWFEGSQGTSCDPCNFNGKKWEGVSCNSNNRVERILLWNNGLNGQLPDTLKLNELVSLSLNGNNFKSGIPNFFGLANLLDLEISNCNLDGRIPNFSNLPKLRFIAFGGNDISGNIPNFSNLQNLETIEGYRNGLSGNLPNFDSCPNLLRINLSDNKLSGMIPNFNQNLEVLDLRINSLSGCFPDKLLNLCQFGEVFAVNSIMGFGFSQNPLLPWQGDFNRFCNGEQQESATCDTDNNSATSDLIDEDCNCVPGCNANTTPERVFEEVIICSDDPVWVYEVQQIQGETYLWEYPNGVMGSCNSPSCNQVIVDYSGYNGPVENTVVVSAERYCGVSEPLFIEFTYLESPQSDFTLSNSIACTNEVIIASALSTNDDFDYNWSMNNLVSVPESGVANFSFDTPGRYGVSLYVANNTCFSSNTTMEVTIHGESNSTLLTEICEGSTFTYRGEVFDVNNPTGDVILGGENEYGCDSIVSVSLSFISVISENIQQTLCENDSINVNGTKYNIDNPSGSESLQSINGCDSIINIELGFVFNSELLIDRELCTGEEFMVNGIIYNESNPAGVEVTTNEVGCDSIITVILNYLSDSENLLMQNLCRGEEIIINGNIYDANNRSGEETLTGANSVGCDSIIMIDLNILEPSATNLVQDICPSQSVTVGSTSYNESNLSGQEILLNSVGCDSVITVQLTLVSFTNEEIFDTICAEDKIEIEGTTYDIDNPTGQEMTTNVAGCDSIINIDLSFYNSENTDETIIICPGESYEREGVFLDFSNPMAGFIYSDQNGCDSIHTVMIEFDAAASVDCVEGVTFVETTTEYVVTPSDGATFDNIDENTASLHIYGRWGNKVVEVNNPSIDYIWNGRTDGGNMLPEGTYYYIIAQNVNADGREIIRKGFITLLN